MSAEPPTANSVLLAAMAAVGNDSTAVINYLADLLAQRTLALDAEQRTVIVLRAHLKRVQHGRPAMVLPKDEP